MKTHRPCARAVSIILLGLAVAAPAWAQSAQSDPPGRVGRVAQVLGTVSFHSADENQWQAATLNYPVTSGNAFWTEPDSHAAIDVGAGRIYLDSSTELDIATVDDQSLIASLPQGVIFLRIPLASGASQYEIDTPRGAVHISRPGQYEIAAGDTDNPTRVIAFNGSAQIVGQDINTGVSPGQAIYISGQGPFSASGGPARQDEFVQYVQTEERPYLTANQAPSYVSPQESGYQDLGRYGQWQQTPNYGPVWMPQQVAIDWAPYRDGHWAYIMPWGWTWVDNAPWGFTPFHYGRWVLYGHRWAWVPGQYVQQPVYAPALVNFFGGINFGGGVSIGIAIGSAVGWVPLGPQEVYVPPYYASPRYVRNVNITNVHNETTIINVVNNKTIINNYINQNAATVVSTNAMANSHQIAPEFKNVPKDRLQQELTKATRTGAQAPVRPTYETAGVTPSLAKKIGVAPPPSGGVPDQRAVPGPAISQGKNAKPQNDAAPLPPINKGNGTVVNGNGGAGGNKAGTQNGAAGPAVTQGQNATPQNDAGQLPPLKGGKGTAVNGNGGAGGNKAGTQNGAAGPAITQGKNATPQNDAGQLPPLKGGKGTAVNGNGGAGGNKAGTQNGAAGPAVTQGQNATPQNDAGQLPPLKGGKGTAVNGNGGAGGNKAGTQNGAAGPAVTQGQNATPQNDAGQLPPLKGGKGTAVNGNGGAGGNKAGTQNGAAGPAVTQGQNATPQNDAGQLPPLKGGKGTAVNGNGGAGGNKAGTQNGAAGPAVTQGKNATPQNDAGQLPPLKGGKGTAVNGNGGAGGNKAGTQNGAAGPAGTQGQNVTPQNDAGQPPPLKNGNGSTANGKDNSNGNAAAVPSAAPGPTIARDGTAIPLKGTSQLPPPKKGDGNAKIGKDNSGGNTAGTQNGAPAAATTQDKSAVPLNGAGQPPPLKKGHGTATTGGSNGGGVVDTQRTAPGPTIAEDQNTAP